MVWNAAPLAMGDARNAGEGRTAMIEGDPRFETREALEQWARDEAAAVAKMPAIYQLNALKRLKRVKAGHEHLLEEGEVK